MSRISRILRKGLISKLPLKPLYVFILTALVVISLVVLLLPAMATNENGNGNNNNNGNNGGNNSGGNGQAGTTLSATITAQGILKKIIEYDWSLEKSASPQSIELGKGESGSVEYKLIASRSLPSEQLVAKVKGFITVTNGGDRETEGLKIIATVQYKSSSEQFTDLKSVDVDTSAKPVLATHESHDYPYEIKFNTNDEDKAYRVVATVTITNHSGSLEELKGPEPKADFNLPDNPVVLIEDETALLTDKFNEDDISGLDGFVFETGESYNSNGWELNASKTIIYTLNIKNNRAECGKTFELKNNARLVELNTGTERTDNASITIETKPCDTQNSGDEENEGDEQGGGDQSGGDQNTNPGSNGSNDQSGDQNNNQSGDNQDESNDQDNNQTNDEQDGTNNEDDISNSNNNGNNDADDDGNIGNNENNNNSNNNTTSDQNPTSGNSTNDDNSNNTNTGDRSTSGSSSTSSTSPTVVLSEVVSSQNNKTNEEPIEVAVESNKLNSSEEDLQETSTTNSNTSQEKSLIVKRKNLPYTGVNEIEILFGLIMLLTGFGFYGYSMIPTRKNKNLQGQVML